MASEAILEKLYQTSKGSLLFKGKTDDEIRKACLKHRDKGDDFIQQTIENIHAKDRELSGEKVYEGGLAEGLQQNVEEGRKEAEHHLQNAEQILDKLMKM